MKNANERRIYALLREKMTSLTDAGLELAPVIVKAPINDTPASETATRIPPTMTNDAFVGLVASIETALQRIADHFDPPKRATVGTTYIAERLGKSVKWIGDLARDGRIPKACICPRVEEQQQWRFWKDKVDEWIDRH